jgi:hypothetical protein
MIELCDIQETNGCANNGCKADSNSGCACFDQWLRATKDIVMDNKLLPEDLSEISDIIGNGIGHRFADSAYDWTANAVVADDDSDVVYTITVFKKIAGT